MLHKEMHTKHLHERLLDLSGRQLFPDAKFENRFKNGERLDEFFIKCDYKVRLALVKDINSLMVLEEQCWSVPMQTDKHEIEKRIQDSACFVFVLEYKNKVIGVNYTQLIHESDIKKVKGKTVARYRVRDGEVAQLIALNVLPVHQDKGWGNELLEFVLRYVSIHPNIRKVYAITRCRDFHKSNCATLQEYFVKIYQNGELNDPILKFHQLHGAKILGLVENYRPYDIENQGYGVMLRYDIDKRPWNGKFSTKVIERNHKHFGNQLLELLHQKLNETKLDHHKSLRELGLDSLDSTEVLIFMHDKVGIDISVNELNNKSLHKILKLCENGESTQSTEYNHQPLKKRIRRLVRQYPEIAPLSLEGDGPCTFWIHPLSGDVGIYNMIAGQADGTFKMIAIKARGFLSKENKPLTSIIDMAKYYCEIITAIEPKGPYNLAGFSFGGTVAYEMVCQLQMKGKEVEKLLLVESPIILEKDHGLFKTNFRNNLLTNANFLLLTLLSMDKNSLHKVLNGEPDWNYYRITDEDVKDIPDQTLVKHIVQFCKQKGLRQTVEELEFKLLSMSDVHISNLQAIQEYHAEKLLHPDNVKAWLFRTESAQAVSSTLWNSDYLENIQREKGSFLPLLQDWNAILPKIQIIILEGDNHFDILHSDKSIKKFYEYCKKIFINGVNESQVFKYSVPDKKEYSHTAPIAIVGMSGRFPDAENVQEFWENLKNGRNSVREVPDDRGWNINDYFDPRPQTPGKTYSKWGGFLTDIDKFDSLFFKISPRDAELMDPSERLFIQEAWKAIEDAGYNPRNISGKPWGVFACAKGDYSITIQNQIESYYLPTDSYSATRLSYLLNLVGPAMTIDTACSSTLSVVVEACKSLILGECEAAIVGGGGVYTTPNILIGSSQSLLFSPDGQCYTFDERANGTVVAEAIGAVVLKRLDKAVEDNDHVYGVIRGWGVNQDGKTNGITAPSGRAQSKLQTGIYEKFDINPENITMFEAHGTGTQLGDAIEYQALTDTFRKFTKNKKYCALGSLKTNIGHAFFGSGIAGLIKVLLSIKNTSIPPSLNYDNASPKMDVENSPFFINTTLKKWETKLGQPCCAAINAFGATGTNAHLVIEEYISTERNYTAVNNSEIIVLSAKQEDRLKEYANALLTAIEKEGYTDEDLADMAYTLQIGRENMAIRLAMVVTSVDELKEKLKAYLKGEIDDESIYSSQAIQNKEGAALRLAQKEIQESIEQWLGFSKPYKLLNLWVRGAKIDWEKLYGNNTQKKMSLPTYPFAKERCWIKEKVGTRKKENDVQNFQTDSALGKEMPVLDKRNAKEPYELMMFTEDWEEVPLNDFRVSELKTIVCFLSDAENQKLVTEQLKSRNQEVHVIFISQGDDFQKVSNRDYLVSRTEKRTYEEAFRAVQTDYREITAVVYLWSYEDIECIKDYQNIVFILQAIASEKVEVEKLILGAQYKNELERCYLDSWIGFERSIGPMISKTRVKVIIEENKSYSKNNITEEVLERLLKEMEAGNRVQSVLYKEGVRYEYKIQEVSGNTRESLEVAPLKTKGTYLITGGLGKLGLIFARHLAQKYNTNLILTGRSRIDKNNQMLINELESLGARVLYIQSDICDMNGMKKGIEEVKEQFKEIHGVIHAAGLVEQKSLFQKEIDNFEKVIHPKIKGTQILDELLRNTSLDFVCYFSSAAAIMGDFGSCDYAVGNRFQMAFTRYKNKLEDQKYALGKSVVINWPVWREGGMNLSPDDSKMYLKSSGQRFLEKEEGLSLFEQILAQPKTQILVLVGQKSKIHQFLKLNRDNVVKPVQTKTFKSVVSRGKLEKIQNTDIEQLLIKGIKKLITELYDIPEERLDVKEHLIEYGLDSINLFEFSRQMSKSFGVEITPSSLLSYSTIEKIVEYLILDHKEAIKRYYNELKRGRIIQEAIPSSNRLEFHAEVLEETIRLESRTIPVPSEVFLEPIAIIGMSGRFPQADTVEDLWKNLKDGKKCISEIPKDRWDWQEHYGDPHKEIGKSNSKWGGFLTNIDRFDPLFFKISPKDAHKMDPSQRLFLEEAWHALEDAGYMGEQIKGKSCGVYVGVEEGEYGFIARQKGQYYSNQNAVLSARIANTLDLKGPNMSITASCSSSLVALHQACQGLRSGDCEMALAGGVNLLVSPTVHVGMSMLDLLSPSGDSYVFDNRADGLVPAEAVGVVLLKPLSSAIRDKDQIYGCIKGSGVNNNGKGHGLMAPNPLRQAELINNILEKYHINSLNINYAISHSVGAKLGDAAEIDGLKKAFKKNTDEQPYCHIGSVKPLIGHTFAASGIVSLITMLMAMKYQTILKLHNFENSNEGIDFSKTPFIANTSNLPWTRRNNQPRLGTISTSANSGTNAFAVIEEYIAPEEEMINYESINQNQIFVFSATNKEQLQAVVKQFLEYIEFNDRVLLSDIAYTLQVGREALASRLAIVTRTKEELVQGLKDYIKPVQVVSSISIFTGNTEDGNMDSKALSTYKHEEVMLQQFIKENNLKLIAIHWKKGGKIPWESLQRDGNYQRISLPGYPFKKEQYWITQEESVSKKKIFSANKEKSVLETIERNIIHFFSKNLEIPKEEIMLNKYSQDYGVDSILIMKFVREFEKNFQIDISASDFIKYPTIGSLSAYLAQKLETNDVCSKPFHQENKLEVLTKNNSEYQDILVIRAMEKYVEGVISINELEKIIGVN